MAPPQSQGSLHWWEWIAPPVLIAALTYVMGWVYAATYFAAFGVGLVSLDIPHQFFFVYGFQVIVDHVWIVLALYAVLVLAGWGLRRHCNTMRQPVIVAGPVAVLLLFLGSYFLAASNARKDFQSQSSANYPEYHRVAVWLQNDTTHDGPGDAATRQIADDLTKGCYRLMMDDGSKLLLISPHPDFPTTGPGVTHVPIDQVRLWRILPHRGSCSPAPAS